MRHKPDSFRIGVIFLLLLSLTARLLPGPRTIDDAFITFRYANNIVSGNGFVYNSFEKVLGTTTPIYTLVLSCFGTIWSSINPDPIPFPTIAFLLNALFDSATCLLLVIIGIKGKATRVGFVTAFLWAIAPFSVTFAIGGLETSLYILLVTTSFFYFLVQKPILASFFGGMSFLTRPDALIFLLPMAGYYLFRLFRPNLNENRKELLKALLYFLVPTIFWFGFATLYFGSPIPHSILAKSEAYRLDPNAAFVRFLQHYSVPFMEQNWAGSIGIAAGLLLYPFLFFVGAIQIIQKDKHFLLFAVYPWLYLFIFSIPNPLIFRWYLAPPLPAYFFFIISGIDILSSKLSDYIKPTSPIRGFVKSAIPILALLYPICSTATEWKSNLDHGPAHPAPDMAWVLLEEQYYQASQRIKPWETPTFSIAAGDVGVLGYYTNAIILDTVGLNSPVSIKYYPLDPALYVINYAVPPDLILDNSPDAVILLEVYGRNGLLQDQRFLSQYSLLEKIPSDIYGSDGMLVYLNRRVKN